MDKSTWALGALLAFGLAACSGQQRVDTPDAPLGLPGVSGRISLEQCSTHDTLPENRPKTTRVHGDARIIRIGLYGGGQVQAETGIRAYAQVEGRNAGPWIEWPWRWEEVLGGWEHSERVVGREEICRLGGSVGRRRLAGGLCFNARTLTWRALDGETVWFGLGGNSPDFYNCEQWDYTRGGALFRCTLPWEPGRLDHSGRPVPEPKQRYVLVLGIR